MASGSPRAVATAVHVLFRVVAVAIAISVAYLAAGLGPVGLIVLVVFLHRGRRPLARVLAHVERGLAPSRA